MVKNPHAVKDTWIGSLGWEDPLEKGMATHSSILARISLKESDRISDVHFFTIFSSVQSLSLVQLFATP